MSKLRRREGPLRGSRSVADRSRQNLAEQGFKPDLYHESSPYRTAVYSLCPNSISSLYERSLSAQSLRRGCRIPLGCLIQNLNWKFRLQFSDFSGSSKVILPSSPARKSFLNLKTFRVKARDSCASLPSLKLQFCHLCEKTILLKSAVHVSTHAIDIRKYTSTDLS